ncbi:hypothetical protein QNM99_09995 [Pseudomonas sp. PCH446]
MAYRIDPRLPTTAYHVMTRPDPWKKPFSRNFVLVRHHLQPPKIEGSPDTPPSLIFYSLYMHLREWKVYRRMRPSPVRRSGPRGDSSRQGDGERHPIRSPAGAGPERAQPGVAGQAA